MQIAKPQTPKDNWVLEFALHFGGDLSAKGIERGYERALDRKPTNAETVATFEWLIYKLLTDKQFSKYVGKGLFAGVDMLDERWDVSFHNMIERLRKELDPDPKNAAWSIEDYYKYADEFLKVRPASEKQRDTDARKAGGPDSSSAPIYRGETLDQWLSRLRESHDIDGEKAVVALRAEASQPQLERAVMDWAARADRERDTDVLCSTVGILCALAGKEHSDRALDVVLAAIARLPQNGPRSFYNNQNLVHAQDLVHEMERSLRRFDEDAVRARMFEEIKSANAALRWFALSYCDVEGSSQFAAGPAPNADILSASKDEHPAVRQRAIEKLAIVYKDDDRVVERLRTAMDDKDTGVVACALHGLSRVHPFNEQLLERLHTLAKRDDSQSQILAAECLTVAAAKNPTTLEAVVKLLKDERWGNEVTSADSARLTAIRGLGSLGAKAKPAASVLYEHISYKNQIVAGAAADAYQKITGEKVWIPMFRFGGGDSP